MLLAQSTQDAGHDAQREASKWDLLLWMGVSTLHASNIKGKTFQLAHCHIQHPVWIRPQLRKVLSAGKKMNNKKKKKERKKILAVLCKPTERAGASLHIDKMDELVVQACSFHESKSSMPWKVSHIYWVLNIRRKMSWATHVNAYLF